MDKNSASETGTKVGWARPYAPLSDRLEHLQEEGKAGVSVGDVAVRAALHVDKGHDDVAQRAQRLVDAGGLPQPLPRRPRRLLPLRACAANAPFLSCCQSVPPIFQTPQAKPSTAGQPTFTGNSVHDRSAWTDADHHKESMHECHVNVRPSPGKAILPEGWLYKLRGPFNMRRQRPECSPARSTRLRRECRICVTPLASVLLHSRVQVKTECERLDSLFMAVSPTFLAAWPLTSRLDTSSTAIPSIAESLSSCYLCLYVLEATKGSTTPVPGIAGQASLQPGPCSQAAMSERRHLNTTGKTE